MWALALLAANPAHGAAAQPPGAPGTVVEVRVHGNHTTPDADILALVGDVVGQPATDALIHEVVRRLEESRRFAGVDVRKRYRSIDNPDDVLLMVVVDERPGVSATDLTPGPWKRFTASGMFLPVLRYEDGYGFTYGARISFLDRLGPSSRVSMPLTWGAERQALVQVERTFARARLAADGGISRREHPHYRVGDTRAGVHVTAEGTPARWLRIGARAGADDVRFGGFRGRVRRADAEAAFDTRVDPTFPRNAVYAAVRRERLTFAGAPDAQGVRAGVESGGHAVRTTLDARGYVGLVGQSVLAVRGLHVSSSRPLPAYEHSLLGGSSTLRGYHAGYRADDNLVALSAEYRVPTSSPLSVGRAGVRLFVDAGAAYPAGARLAAQPLDVGYGAGVFVNATVFSLSLDIARRETGGVRAHFGMGLTLK